MQRPNIIKWDEKAERKIQERIITFLEKRQWFVKSTHGNMFQSGFPDLFACHVGHGQRWIEVKRADQYCFTSGQMRDFPEFSKRKCGIWIMTDATEAEYEKLFKAPNWLYYVWLLNQRGDAPTQR